ncbi:MAG: hypothetical protein EOP53_00050 [Sphingobacteriales bacterium]|nr:MAG: hypothetical protein EOP53_00050 [Sphingobacteriales bacterium]
MKQIFSLAILFITAQGFAQKVNWEKLNSLNPDKILMDGPRKPTKVLLLGSFHFGYPNLDKHKTDSSKFIDVLSAERQKEIQQLADVIMQFKPTRFYIEGWNQAFQDSLFNEYVNGKYKLGRNENYQLGYRVAKLAGLKKVYAVDASNFASENFKKYQWIDSMWNLNNMVDSARDKYWGKKFNDLYTISDSIETTLTMLENFLLMAQPSTLKRMHGAYLTGGFATTEDNGPDMLAMWWYSRNLRIFNKILQTKPAQEDRIVVLFGNGHAPILKQCFESSPEFELVELKSLLK